MKRLVIPVALAVLAFACGTPIEKTRRAAQRVSNALEVGAPLGRPENARERDRERFDLRWRQLQSFRAAELARAQAQQRAAQEAARQQIQFVTGLKESFKHLDANGINSAPVAVPITGDVKGPSVLKAQVYLDRLHFSVGAIDGRWGKNSAISVWWWQRSHGIEATGDVDEATFRSLADAAGYGPAVEQYSVTAEDLQGPFVHIPASVYDQQHLSCLCYETVREKLAEKFHIDQDFFSDLNPDVKFSDLQPGAMIIVPNVRPPLAAPTHDVARIVISIAGNTFNCFDGNENLIFHAPTTVGSTYDPSPAETLHVIKIIDLPHFHYDPTLYHEVPDYMPDAHLSPGPNSPVGIVWMALSKEHYGIHGTKDPESIGYVSSHGCVRLTNWDAAEVEQRISEGVRVSFVDTKRHED